VTCRRVSCGEKLSQCLLIHCYSCGTVNFTNGCKPPWLRSIIAIVVVVCVLVGVIGYGLVRFEFAASAPPPSVLVSLGADDIERADPDHDGSPAAHIAFSTVTRHRALPPRLRSLPLSSWAVSVPILRYRLGVPGPGLPATSLAGQELLTQLCIARR
jgi:hypothetical protein